MKASKLLYLIIPNVNATVNGKQMMIAKNLILTISKTRTHVNAHVRQTVLKNVQGFMSLMNQLVNVYATLKNTQS